MDILVEYGAGSVWAAALDDKNKLQALELDPAEETVRWGAIYYARVKQILKNDEAVVLDLDGTEEGYLNFSDIRGQAGEKLKPGDIERYFSGGDMVLVQAKNTAFHNSAAQDSHVAGPETPKRPRMSMDIALAGRYLIYTPLSPGHRVSSRIADGRLREQLREMAREIREIEGCILRASAANRQTDILRVEGQTLKNIWTEILRHAQGSMPMRLTTGPGAIVRVLSDMADQPIRRIELADPGLYEAAEIWCASFAMDLIAKLVLTETGGSARAATLFDIRGVTDQIEALFYPYFVLPGGGNLIIQETSALTAIDVNAAGRKALDANLEAAGEVARQIRLRNLGGIIMIDFVSMQRQNERDAVQSRLRQAALLDPCTLRVEGWTRLGLIEVNRARRSAPLATRFEAT